MAELGAIASVVQLVGVALRVSAEVRSFLDAYKDTARDVKSLRDLLRDVEANVRNLRRYILKFKKSKITIEEFEVLSEAVVGALKGYEDDILVAKRLLPAKPEEKMKEKLRWVIHREKAHGVIERLSQRNTRLNTALAITGRLHDLRILQDTQTISNEQAKYHKTLDSFIQKQDQTHIQLLSQAHVVSTNVNNLHKSSNHEHQDILSSISRQFQHMDRGFNRSDVQNVLLLENVRDSNNNLSDLRSQTEHMFAQSLQSINTVSTELQDIHTQTTFIASSIEATTKVVRQELRTTITPIIEQALNTMDTRTEARMKRLENLIKRIVYDIGHDTQPPIHSKISETEPRRFPTGSGAEQSVGSQRNNQFGVNLIPTHAISGDQDAEIYHSTVTHKRRWYQKWMMSSIEVEVLHTSHRVNGLPSSDSVVVITVHFRPSQSILNLPGISILYNTGPNHQGYYQFGPMIATISIISESHPVWKIIYEDDVQRLQQMLIDGGVHIRGEDERGSTLLHYAAYCGRISICKFLSSQGLSWYHLNAADSRTPVHEALDSLSLAFDQFNFQELSGILELLDTL